MSPNDDPEGQSLKLAFEQRRGDVPRMRTSSNAARPGERRRGQMRRGPKAQSSGERPTRVRPGGRCLPFAEGTSVVWPHHGHAVHVPEDIRVSSFSLAHKSKRGSFILSAKQNKTNTQSRNFSPLQACIFRAGSVSARELLTSPFRVFPLRVIA